MIGAALSGHAASLPPLARRRSEKDGTGVFALAAIPRGAFIAKLSGRRVHRDDVDWAAEGLIMQLDDDWFMEEAGGIDDLFNHSCACNMAFTADGDGFYALRDIAMGEELTFDYSTCEDDAGWSIACQCGAAGCRGQITGFSGLDAATQRALLPHCRPYLRGRFDQTCTQ